VPDTTPPVLTVPAPIVTNATGPGGTAVSYSATASDTIDPSPTVSCTPNSGSTFPIGTTTVQCTATDAAGNISHGPFTVTVNGVAAQLQDLAAAVNSAGPGSSFANKVAQIQAAVAANDRAGACNALSAFINQANAQSGKSISAGTASKLIAQATNIRAVLGC